MKRGRCLEAALRCPLCLPVGPGQDEELDEVLAAGRDGHRQVETLAVVTDLAHSCVEPDEGGPVQAVPVVGEPQLPPGRVQVPPHRCLMLRLARHRLPGPGEVGLEQQL